MKANIIAIFFSVLALAAFGFFLPGLRSAFELPLPAVEGFLGGLPQWASIAIAVVAGLILLWILYTAISALLRLGAVAMSLIGTLVPIAGVAVRAVVMDQVDAIDTSGIWMMVGGVALIAAIAVAAVYLIQILIRKARGGTAAGSQARAPQNLPAPAAVPAAAETMTDWPDPETPLPTPAPRQQR